LIASQHFILAYTTNWLRRIHQEEEDDDDEYFFSDNDENLIMANQFLQQQASGSHWRHNTDAPPRWLNKKDHATGDAHIRAYYFGPNHVYSPMHFHMRYVSKLHKIDDIAMSQQILSHFVLVGFDPHVFTRLVEAVQNVNSYFHFKYDAVGKAGLSALQNCVAAIRILAYGLPVDVDEYVRIGESTARESLNHFCVAIINVFEQQYLRAPTTEDVARILHQNEQRG
jgi:hypothetical protein